MHPQLASSSRSTVHGPVARLFRLIVLLLPAAILLLVSFRLEPEAGRFLVLGATGLALGGFLAWSGLQESRQPIAPPMIVLSVIALGWLIFTTSGMGRKDDWGLHLAQSVLLVIPLLLFSIQCLRDSGAPAHRRARLLADRLSHRREWPRDLMLCRMLPEVMALREALHVDATPALSLLNHAKPQVRVAALAALEFRQNWRHGQPELVLQIARLATEPEVRASAVNALANIDDRLTVEALAEFLDDRSPIVRHTAMEALLWNTEGRWEWVRHAVRKSLADPDCLQDGPLPVAGDRLGSEAVTDLHTWCGEKGVLAQRAAITLGAHYAQQVPAGDPNLFPYLRELLVEPHTPAILRLELAQLLRENNELSEEMLRQMLDPAMPAPVRLIGAESLLGDGYCPEAMCALYELARLPNREIALATADVIQRRLGVDLGLPPDQPLPQLSSRLAAEVARRVLLWAGNQQGSSEPSSSAQIPRASRVSRRISP
jgi:HEAT repeats